MGNEVLFARRKRGHTTWAEITLNRPDKGNALNISMMEELTSIVSTIASEPSIRAVVLRATGRFFCTGGDIAAWGALSSNEMSRDWILKGIDLFDRIASLQQPVIAAVSGHALGGGLELALAADLRVGLTKAKFGFPEVTLGMISGWMGVRRLAETIGTARARHLALLGTAIPAQQALDWGLITSLAEDDAALDGHVGAWLEQLLSNGPIAMSLTKGILRTMHLDMRHHHAAATAHAAGTNDCKEGVQAFLEKRKPLYENN